MDWKTNRIKQAIHLLNNICHFILCSKNNGIKINHPLPILSHEEEPIDLNDIESEDSLIFKIKRLNPDFDVFNFKNSITDMYLSIRQTYKEKNLNNIKSFQSNELYEKQSKEIINYIKLNQTNITDNITIDSIKILSCNEDLLSNSIKIKTQIKVRQINYTIEDRTHRIIAGHPKVLQKCTYEWIILYKTTYDSSNNIQHIYVIDSIQ